MKTGMRIGMLSEHASPLATLGGADAGGQNVQKNDTAVRITHLPTGIVTQCQNERSQHSNRDKAYKMLRAALYEKELERRQKELNAIAGERLANEWGSQIRSYVLHPYQLAKDHRTDFDNYFSYKKIIKKIDTSISHNDEWKVFEYNFNQVHEEFFNKLKTKHPKLTVKDLRLCAYIKMNLSTKEIAPLLNISIRGVETQRYRLRTKLGLDSEQSLTEYLEHFK